MPIYYDLAEQISCIDTRHIRDDFVAAYLIQSGDELAFVDTGCFLSVPNLLAVLSAKNLQPAQVRYIFVTHIHLDHAGGAGELARFCPNAQVVVHEKGAYHLEQPAKLKAGVLAVYGETFFKQHLGDITPTPPTQIRVANVGYSPEDIYLGKRKLTLINSPGHANHHYCIWDEQSGGMFSGDTLGVSYHELNTHGVLILPPTSPSQFSPEIWLKTIDMLMQYQPKKAYLTHFNTLEFSPEITQQLKNHIHEFCQIAIEHQDISQKNLRHQAIKKTLTAYLLALLPLVLPKKAQQVLKGDIEICAQGLGVWLDGRQE